MFNTPEEREERRTLIAQRQQEQHAGTFDFASSLLEYHIALVELLVDLTTENSATTSKCQSLSSMIDIKEHLDEPLPANLRTAYVNFFTNCFLTTKKPLEANVANDMWGVIESLVQVTHDAVRLQGDEHKRMFEAISLAISTFLDSTVALLQGDFRQQVVDKLAAAYKTLLGTASLVKAASCQAARAAVSAITQACKVSLSDFGTIPDIDPDAEAAAESRALKGVGDTKDAIIHRCLLNFSEQFKQKMCLEIEGQMSTEFRELLRLFIDPDPEKTEERPPSLPEPSDEIFESAGSPERHGNLNTFILINQTPQLYNELSLKRSCLEIVEALARYEDPDLKLTVQMSQNRLDKLGEYALPSAREKYRGATRMMLQMLVDPRHNETRKEILDVGIALLLNGNKNCQDRVAEYMQSHHGLVFFETIRDIIRAGCEEVKDILAHHKRVKEITAALGENSSSLQDAIPQFTERSQMILILRFIQLTCEGHNPVTQNLWREQNARRSFDIVSEITEYLATLYASGITINLLPHTQQCLRTITELMQGPCTGNQAVIARTKFAATCNRILQSTRFPGCSVEDKANLKEDVVIAISAILESCTDDRVPIGIANEITIEYLMKILEEAKEKHDQATNKLSSEVQEELETAFIIYSFLLTLNDFVPSVRALMRDPQHRELVEFYEESTGHIEIFQQNALSRLYFRKPIIAECLSDLSKKRLLWSVDRSSASKKLEDFLSQAGQLASEMKHQHAISRSKYLSMLLSNEVVNFLNSFALLIAVILNFIMLFGYDHSADTSPSHLGDRSPVTAAYAFAVILAFIQTLRFGQFVAVRAPLVVRAGLREQLMITRRTSPERAVRELIRRTLSVIGAMLRSLDFVSEVGLMTCTVLSLAVSPLFTCVHLTIYMVQTSVDLQNVLRSLTLNGRSLTVTAVFGVVLVYVFSIWAFYSFRDKYVSDDGASRCENLFHCTVTTLHGGLRKGDVGEVLQNTEWDKGNVDPEFIIFQLLFWATIITIMLNIIFGIIIDTFGELRTIKADTESDIENNCFICSIDRYTFDRLTSTGFEHHIKKHHNMWEYLFFLVMLQNKDPNDYTGPESFVAECVKQKSSTWFPINKAITLIAHHRAEKDAQTQLASSVEDTKSRTDELMKAVSQLSTKVAGMSDILSKMQQQQKNNPEAQLPTPPQ
eukprot:c19460_g1_i1.p1 GENE.c19460_g1_i1~~c19460_g1_i1.p1  ORF type:complete len:1219 (+),score=349.54 c19460_g1_i1:135-3659(+)